MSWLHRARKTVGLFLARASSAAFPLALFLVLAMAIGLNLGAAMGVPTLFRDDPDLRNYDCWWLNSPAIWGQATASLLVFVIWGGINVSERITYHLQHENEAVVSQTWKDRLRYVAANGAPFLVLLLVAAAWPRLWQRQWLGAFWEVVEALVGMTLAAGFVACAGLLVTGLRRIVIDRVGEHKAFVWLVDAFRWLATPSGTEKIPSEVVDDFWIFLGGAAFLSIAFGLWKVILPCVAITLLAILLSTSYFLLLYVRKSLRLLMVALFFGALIAANHDPYSARFPGLGSYEQPLSITPGSSNGRAPGSLDLVQVLEKWERQGKRPKLVVVTVSGGAYRSGFWSALVLDELVARSRKGGELEGLDRSVRLLTGASGGMVAAGYFVALASPTKDKSFPSIERTLLGDIAAFRDKKQGRHGKFPTALPIERDGLSPVAQQLVQRDLPRYLLAPLLSWSSLGDWTRWDDRGLVLEQQWHTLGGTFSELADGEREGWRPSIILSPMMIETGQPLLISNLDLSDLAKADHSVELFSLFPDARSTFRLRTAVRMNASFPYVSPAVSLPTSPTRRIVDAGYYDNYGVSVASAWLTLDRVRAWLDANTSGVIVIQINAYDSKSESKPPSWPSIASRFITSPIEGMGAARASSMVFRNAQQLDAVKKLYRPEFVKSYVFENAAESSDVEMSWYLRPEALEKMRSELASPRNQETFRHLKTAWQN